MDVVVHLALNPVAPFADRLVVNEFERAATAVAQNARTLPTLAHPQVIRRLFNAYRFGPPLALTPASTCSWIDHFVSGLQHLTNSPY